MRTPETLTAQERAAQLKLPAKQEDNPVTTKEQRTKDAMRAGLTVPSRNAIADLNPFEDIDGALVELDVLEDLERYARNPRTKANPAYADIKASMQAEGAITNTITVTRESSIGKYHPYSGGNTRIEIAQELVKAGDMRFQRIKCLTKKWPGHAAVIVAHLGENDNRGDISFWERAQAVARFKTLFEEEYKRALSTPELAKELKSRGLSYGIRMVQNFVFALENLTPLGPWLRTEDVNAAIRPLVSSYFDLANKFDLKNQVAKSIEDILAMHGKDQSAVEAANKNLDETERTIPQVDLPSLLTDLQSVTARALGTNVENVPAMVTALAANPRITTEELGQVRGDGGNAMPRFVKTAKTPKQAPLGSMLGTVPAKPKSNEDERNAPNPPLNAGDTGNSESPVANMERALSHIDKVIPISDFLRPSSTLPCGFLIEIPDSFRHFNGQALPESVSDFRQLLWGILASFTGQFNQTYTSANDQAPTWTAAISGGDDLLRSICAEQAGNGIKNGRLYISTAHIWQLISHPEIGPAVISFVREFSSFYEKFPKRFHVPYQALFHN